MKSEHSLVEQPATAVHPHAVHPGSGPDPFDHDEESGGGLTVGRIVRALSRFKWVLVLAVFVGAGAAYATWRFIDPEYVAQGNLWIESEDRGTLQPISQGGLLTENAWVELMRTYAVLDPVVLKEKLYLEVGPDMRWMFDDFDLASRFRPGSYRLTISPDHSRWTLQTREGVRVESGVPGDSIGQSVGFLWRPQARHLSIIDDFDFTVVTPRDASRDLGEELSVRMDRGANFISVQLRGEDPEEIASILNSLMERHVELAAELKSRKLNERRDILEDQLMRAEEELRSAERELEDFRVNTVTLPSENATPLAPGLEVTRDPVFQNFFEMKLEQEQLQRDRNRLRALLDGMTDSTLAVEAIETIPSTSRSSQLEAALGELIEARSQLRALRQRYTDEFRPVRDLATRVRTLETETLPALLRGLLAEIEQREAALGRLIDQASDDLSDIPTRSIEEARLRRRVRIQETIYNELRQRVETTRLAAASSIPDISILDDAAVPNVPANDERLRMVLIVFAGVLGLGALAAVGLDWVDPKLHDPAELEGVIGINVLGAIPTIGDSPQSDEERVLEAFRELRLNVEFAHGAAGPLLTTITSPSKGEGKSLVCANLAVVFAEIGKRTLLLDGDTRQGDVHSLLGTDRKPGLTDYLQGGALENAIQRTRYPTLDVMGSGSRSSSSPEMLASSRMRDMVSEVKTAYDVIIVDSPPLAAGADAALLAALTGSLTMVVRSGSTDRQMISAKLDGLRRFPIRVLGAVLNDFAPTGRFDRYHYYSNYLPGYEAREEPEAFPEEEELVSLPAGADGDEGVLT